MMSFLDRTTAVLTLVVTFLWQLVLSSVRVAQAALSPGSRPHSAVIAVPLDVRSDMGITALANLVTLTPGTTSLHVSPTRDTLYVHVLDSPGSDAVRSDIKGGFERLIRRIER